tara:strand:- start:594 stop:941 length:348 start_codon:yes stop_codon:yes gene_type:complete
MQKLSIFIYFFGFNLFSSDFCVIDNILKKNEKIINCNDKKLLFGHLEFKSKKKDLKFQFNKELNEYVPQSYKHEILTFIRKNCYKKTLKIKTITNFNNNSGDYMNEVIIKCKLKS